jgi:hypothetical protein
VLALRAGGLWRGLRVGAGGTKDWTHGVEIVLAVNGWVALLGRTHGELSHPWSASSHSAQSRRGGHSFSLIGSRASTTSGSSPVESASIFCEQALGRRTYRAETEELA